MEWTTPTPENLAALVEKHSGLSGDSESETFVRWDRVTDCLHFWSCIGSHVAHVVRRNPDAVLRFKEDGLGVSMQLKGRPPWMVVAKGKSGSTPEQKAKAAARFAALKGQS